MDSRPFCPIMPNFCCCGSIRFGANFIGWFNFILNALYIGVTMKSLASIHDAVDVMYGRLNGDYYVFPAFHDMKNIADQCHNQSDIKAAYHIQQDQWPHFIRKHKKLLQNCEFIQENVTLVETIDIIELKLMPQFYWSSAIPLIVFIMSVGWLTAVEGGSIRFMKAMGYSFVSSILLQIILQLYFIAHFHGQLRGLLSKHGDNLAKKLSGGEVIKSDRLALLKAGEGLHWSVWLIFFVYALFNLYAIPIIITYMHKRSGIDHQILDESKMEEEPKFSNTYNRMGVRNRSFRIEDDPMGDNFRQSLEDIRVGFRETVPKTPALSRVTSLADEPIPEDDEES